MRLTLVVLFISTVAKAEKRTITITSPQPPQAEGPVAGVTLDVDSLAREYRQAMGWEPDSGQPEESTLEKLGLTQLVKKHG